MEWPRFFLWAQRDAIIGTAIKLKKFFRRVFCTRRPIFRMTQGKETAAGGDREAQAPDPREFNGFVSQLKHQGEAGPVLTDVLAKAKASGWSFKEPWPERALQALKVA